MFRYKGKNCRMRIKQINNENLCKISVRGLPALEECKELSAVCIEYFSSLNKPSFIYIQNVDTDTFTMPTKEHIDFVVDTIKKNNNLLSYVHATIIHVQNKFKIFVDVIMSSLQLLYTFQRPFTICVTLEEVFSFVEKHKIS